MALSHSGLMRLLESLRTADGVETIRCFASAACRS